ncbi:hypothetical protein B0H19DRAFT_1274674 [Mycena capillaripes]|nr:hypothetical protein B0H19DRAFT_1274674 [Mycena capillaripes]
MAALVLTPIPVTSTPFAIADKPPPWPGADDDAEMGLASISELALEEEVGMDEGIAGGEREYDSTARSYAQTRGVLQ